MPCSAAPRGPVARAGRRRRRARRGRRVGRGRRGMRGRSGSGPRRRTLGLRPGRRGRLRGSAIDRMRRAAVRRLRCCPYSFEREDPPLPGSGLRRPGTAPSMTRRAGGTSPRERHGSRGLLLGREPLLVLGRTRLGRARCAGSSARTAARGPRRAGGARRPRCGRRATRRSSGRARARKDPPGACPCGATRGACPIGDRGRRPGVRRRAARFGRSRDPFRCAWCPRSGLRRVRGRRSWLRGARGPGRRARSTVRARPRRSCRASPRRSRWEARGRGRARARAGRRRGRPCARFRGRFPHVIAQGVAHPGARARC